MPVYLERQTHMAWSWRKGMLMIRANLQIVIISQKLGRLCIIIHQQREREEIYTSFFQQKTLTIIFELLFFFLKIKFPIFFQAPILLF